MHYLIFGFLAIPTLIFSQLPQSKPIDIPKISNIKNSNNAQIEKYPNLIPRPSRSSSNPKVVITPKEDKKNS